MKTTAFTLIISCILINIVNAQKTIEIDFSTKENPIINVNNICVGDYYQVKIKNINLNLFKVSLTSVDTILSKPQQTPTFGNFDIDALSKVIAGISPQSTSVSPIQKDMWQGFKEVYNTLKLKSEFSASIITTNIGIIDRMEQEKKSISATKLSFEQMAFRIDNLKLEVYKVRLNSFRIETQSSTYNFTQALTEIENIRGDISELKTKILGKNTSYEEFSTNNKTAITGNPDLTTNDKAIKESYDKLISALSDAFASISAEKTNELLSTIVFIENNKSNTYTSLPLKFMGEQTKVRISIVPKDEKYNLQSYYTQIVFPQELKNYIVVGASFYVSNLYDNVYSTIKTQISDSTSAFRFKEENVGKAELGIAALLRYGKKLNDRNNFGGHFTIGAGMSISNKVKPRVLFGGGISLGEKHMLSVDLGGNVGYVDRLSDAIDLTTTYSERPENITVSKLGFGVFLSLGYIYQF